jgi:hypothetical protein
MTKQIGLGLVAAALALAIGPAAADGRSVAYLQGAAFAIAANCPKLLLDTKAIALAKKGIKGVRQGGAADFADGAFQFHGMLNDGVGDCGGGGCTCENICGFRPGTCYFLKD